MGTQACGGGGGGERKGGRIEAVVFELAPVFSVELCRGAGLVLAFKAMSFQCCSRLSCIPGRLVGRGGEGWIVCLHLGLVAGMEMVWVYSSVWTAVAVT